MRNDRLVVLAVAITVSAGGRASADDAADPLARVTAAHRVARESIRTFEARWRFDRTLPDAKEMGAGAYLRAGDDALILTGTEGKSAGAILTKGGESRTVVRAWSAGQPVRYRASRASAAVSVGLSDLWQRLLLVHVGPDQQPLPFERFVETATGPVHASADRDGGREVVTVTFPVGTGPRQTDRSFEFDAGVNYLVRKASLAVVGFRERSEVEVVEFREPQPGVYVPARCRTRHFKGGVVDEEWVVALSDVVVNAPVPAGRLALPAVPSGTVLTDRTQQLSYAIDANWQRIGPATPAPVMAVAKPPDEQIEYTAPSETEPPSSGRLVVALSLLVVLVAGVVWGVRRRASRAAG